MLISDGAKSVRGWDEAHYWNLSIVAISIVSGSAVDNRRDDGEFIREKPFLSRNNKLFRDAVLDAKVRALIRCVNSNALTL